MKRANQGEEFIVNAIRQRIYVRNQNAIIMALGPTGSGKSWATLRLGELIDRRHRPLRTYSLNAFMDNAPVMQRGEAVIWDDIGATGGGARDWASKASRAVTYFIESFRMLNTCLLISVPTASMVDITFRRLSHYVLVMQRIDYKKNRSLARLFEWWTNEVTGKYGVRHPQRQQEGIGPESVYGIWMQKPTQRLVDQYEAEKAQALNEQWRTQREALVQSSSRTRSQRRQYD